MSGTASHHERPSIGWSTPARTRVVRRYLWAVRAVLLPTCHLADRTVAALGPNVIHLITYPCAKITAARVQFLAGPPGKVVSIGVWQGHVE
jgi:hypothetical protein